MTLDLTDRESKLVDLTKELRRQLDTKRDYMADTRRVSFQPELQRDGSGDGFEPNWEAPLWLSIDLPDGEQSLAPTGHAHNQIGVHYGIASSLYDRLKDNHPTLFQHLLNGLLTREHTTRMVRTMDGKARAFLSNKFRPRDNWDLFEQAILPALDEHQGSAFHVKTATLTETRMYLKLVLPDFEKQITPKVGDVVRGGLIVQNSEVGAGSLVIAPYTDVLWCTNGAVHTDYGKRQRHVGKRIESDEESWELYSDDTLRLDDEAFFAKCRDTVKAVLNETVFDAIVEQMRDLAGIKLDDPVKAVELVSKRHSFTEGEHSSIMAALIEGGDRSAWGLVNGITQTARDLEDCDRQTHLETLAGRIVNDWSLAGVA